MEGGGNCKKKKKIKNLYINSDYEVKCKAQIKYKMYSRVQYFQKN